jgi:hypothetical protein
MPAVTQSNGQTVSRQTVEERLTGEPLTQGYRPTLPVWALWTSDTVPQLYLLRDVELMMIHPVVLNVLNYFKAGLYGAEFDIVCGDPTVSEFLHDQCRRFWDIGVPLLQGGYEYGWIGTELMYGYEGNYLAWKGMFQFSPRDVYILTQDHKPIGIRIKHVIPSTDEKKRRRDTQDLWLSTPDIPAKGLWYAHTPRYSEYYGVSQLLGAWRPWRRLAWRDAAETVIDGGVYRFAYAGPVIRYPEEDYASQLGTPGTTLDSQGRPRKYARDIARQISEWYKTGAGVGLPSSKYPDGADKWEFTIPESTLNVDGLIHYVEYLCKQISYGIGVPPELIEAAESGSGYSGRAIPMEGFMMAQQRLANNMLNLFLTQVLQPLVKWNWGDVKWTAKVKNLLETKRRLQLGDEAQGHKPQIQLPSPGTNTTGVPGQRRDGTVPPVPQMPQAPMSLANNDDRIREIARKILQVAA